MDSANKNAAYRLLCRLEACATGFFGSPKRGRRAFTLVELLLALAIAGIISAVVAAMLVAVSYGTSSQRDLRAAVVKGKVLDARIGSAIRSSRAILEAGADYLVLWAGDINTNGTSDAPDLSEIRLIERDSSNDKLSRYKFPGNWTQAQIDAADVSYQLSGNPPGFFQSATAAAKTAGSFVPTLWGSEVMAIGFDLDHTDPAVVTLAGYRLTIQVGDLSETVIGAASVRHNPLNGN
ncbi:MAG: prepilin-type N-terminal cleavage/methylation domain-containing protein [Phycisphaerae bacterium]|nr:prepilin-type N-terminal cleavage/methylation domain-containing protein [Phycisphaerae bacterium]